MYESMKGMLAKANAEGYAVMAINAFNLETARGVITAAEEMNASHHHRPAPGPCEGVFRLRRADRPHHQDGSSGSCPVAINLDHGHDIAHLKRCLHEGFSSVMCDASACSDEENARITKEVVELADMFGASVEAEVGNMGRIAEDGVMLTDAAMYTDPDAAIPSWRRPV